MGKGRIMHFGFSGAIELFEAESVPFRGKRLGIDNHLRNIAIKEGLASLSSPMVGECWKALVMLKSKHLQSGKWRGYTQLNHSSFDSYLNPKLLDRSAETVEEWQECCGYPGVRLLLGRARKVKVEYREDGQGEEKRAELVDFPARLLQHQMDHIQSIDPLKLATKIEIIQPQLRAQYDEPIQQLFSASVAARSSSHTIYQRTPEFNALRRQLAFCITDHYRK